MPPLVIVCGPPASGKTTLAGRLSRELGLPILSKDSLKEAMMDHLGGAPAVGEAAFAVQFGLARELLASGVGIILEGAFFADQSDLAEVAAHADAVVVQLESPLEILERRYTERVGDPSRHLSHRGLEALLDLRRRVLAGSYEPPDIGRPVLRVDTADGVKPSEQDIVRWVREHLGADLRSTSPNRFYQRAQPAEPIDLGAAWDEQARSWTRWAREPGHDSYWRFGRAAFFDLLPPPGRLTLDVGCGEGRVSRDLAAIGHRVVGIDASRTMVQEALAARQEGPVLVADAAALPLVDQCCDLVVAHMSLQDVDDMAAAIHEMARVLEPGGCLCLAIVHPINSAGQFESLDPDSPFVIRGSYLDSTQYVDHIESGDLAITFASTHRPLEEYFGALEAAGFAVESLREVPVDDASEKADPARGRARWRRLPLFLDLRAVKRSSRLATDG